MVFKNPPPPQAYGLKTQKHNGTSKQKGFQYSYFSIRIFTTPDPISNVHKRVLQNFLMQTLCFSINLLYFTDICQLCTLVSPIPPHPTLHYPILSRSVSFFSCTILRYHSPYHSLWFNMATTG